MSELNTMEQVDEDMQNEAHHIPVMHDEVIAHLNLKSGQSIMDCTLGMAGHALSIVKKIGPQGRLICLDRDQESLALAREKLKDYARQCLFIHDDYRNIDKVLDHLRIKEVDGMLFDLGISSYQLNNPERGFSSKLDGPLDMRMDKNSYISAFDLINSLSERELSSILRNFGQERWHNRIALALVLQRSKKPIESTHELNEVILKAIPNQYQKQKIHPATRTFQAMRIAVNRELEALEIALGKSIQYLKAGGRICVIAFHSLEDKIVKEKFRNFARYGRLKLITKKVLVPGQEEVNKNPRARSARLRVAERT